VRPDAITLIIGIGSTINALFGGHPAIVARSAAAILAGPEGGPKEQRYTGNLIAASTTIVIALFATPLASLIDILPKTYVVVLAGLAILSPFQDSLVKSFSGDLRFGAVIAFGIAATPFAFYGITSAVWAIIGGLIASLAAERGELLAHWKNEQNS
jgi:benzoate membrane transport protein